MKSVADRRLGRTIGFALYLLTPAALILSLSGRPATTGLALGLALPGAGLWPGIVDDGGLLCLAAPAWISYPGATLMSATLFAFAVVFWGGAGNLIAAPDRVWDGAALGLMQCEPNWVYPLCNAIAASAHMRPRWRTLKGAPPYG